ncbi:Hydroxymethylbilane synthase [Ignavibacterium album JCM 16511]|uniref:Porphobilinogen deaminase n=1 Tax=Ignavibacterium album (strain DSM 19864 / JCM 16511 / NBRC 101810 / Mat9-16) TaxID=945713 RepID=I0AGZ7_IGNAJ|nr:hydroxymethylbilane synthase [Ignavibacterium album]AFH48254.1 Hydroxymethylbilane synthase [Ignavibacterium album JCM 16511]
MNKKLLIGSRGSELALWQANFVKKELEKKHRGLSVEIKIIKTKGDKILDVALSKIGDKSLFTKELEVELLSKRIDIAVHSLKDLQTQIPEGLKLAAVTKRHDVEDVLIARKKGLTIHTLPENAVVATGSLRRRAQLQHLRPDIKVVDLRGNVPSRIKKFLESDWDAIILARAGVERLGLKKYISSYISKEEILPAVGQGALGIEIHTDNQFAEEILQSIHHQNTFTAVSAERALLRALEGGCQVPIGAFAEVQSNGLYLDAMVGSLDGSITFRKKVRGRKDEPEKLGRSLAKDLLKAGAKDILDEVYNNSRK